MIRDPFQEELATLESIDSGAVYTLALKTHVGMSIDVWRYMAGWCDKIEVYLLFLLHFPDIIVYVPHRLTVLLRTFTGDFLTAEIIYDNANSCSKNVT